MNKGKQRRICTNLDSFEVMFLYESGEGKEGGGVGEVGVRLRLNGNGVIENVQRKWSSTCIGRKQHVRKIGRHRFACDI